MDVTLKKMLERNFELSYLAVTDPVPQYLTCSFFASKINIVIEDKPVGSEKNLASGEIRLRNKKRIVTTLAVPFFGKFNDFVNEQSPSYAEFETIINCPTLTFKWLGNNIQNKYYNIIFGHEIDYSPFTDLITVKVTKGIDVIVKEKQTEFLNDYYDKRIINLTLWETKNWYAIE